MQNEITVRKKASGSHLRDGARQTWLEKKDTIEIFNLTYAELSILKDQLEGYAALCNSKREKGHVLKMIKEVALKMSVMVKQNVA